MMFMDKKQVVSFADDQSVHFANFADNAHPQSMGGFVLSSGEDGDPLTGPIPQTVNKLLIIPDYWVGSRVDTLQARKNSVIASFVERKLRQDQSAFPEVSDFYCCTAVQSHDHSKTLYTYFLQEANAYRVHQQLTSLGCQPRGITSPALLWQARLGDLIQGFGEKGIGFLHLCDGDCFLYLYFRGQYIFSRNIQLTEGGEDSSQTYAQLQYEINQSSYLYAQKTKSSPDEFFVLASDTKAAGTLTDLMGREVKEISQPLTPGSKGDLGWLPNSCKSFRLSDFERKELTTITHKPLQKELYWHPVQWTGIAVGLVLILLLALEAFYLQTWSTTTRRQISDLNAVAPEPPEMVLQETAMAIEEIQQILQRPSGSSAVLQAFLSENNSVHITKLSLTFTPIAQLSVFANVQANDPKQFKTRMRVFLKQLNERFRLSARPLKENDVKIAMDRSQRVEDAPVYQIQLTFELSS